MSNFGVRILMGLSPNIRFSLLPSSYLPHHFSFQTLSGAEIFSVRTLYLDRLNISEIDNLELFSGATNLYLQHVSVHFDFFPLHCEKYHYEYPTSYLFFLSLPLSSNHISLWTVLFLSLSALSLPFLRFPFPFCVFPSSHRTTSPRLKTLIAFTSSFWLCLRTRFKK